MADNRHYWEGKNDRATVAKQHTNKMSAEYGDEIKKVVDRTILYVFDVPEGVPSKEGCNQASIKPKDSVSAVMTEAKGKTAVLNFASYKYPGGGFLAGSRAQEECLCHDSFLYNVLKEFPDYYAWNNERKNKALYENRALYTPNVRFFKDGKEQLCDVITCASPNFSAAEKYCHVTREENKKVLKDRIQFVLDIAKTNRVDTLILGAYGCGVFGQDATEVAQIFYDFLKSDDYQCFEHVIFAIPEDRTNNYEKFKDVFAKKYINDIERG